MAISAKIKRIQKSRFQGTSAHRFKHKESTALTNQNLRKLIKRSERADSPQETNALNTELLETLVEAIENQNSAAASTAIDIGEVNKTVVDAMSDVIANQKAAEDKFFALADQIEKNRKSSLTKNDIAKIVETEYKRSRPKEAINKAERLGKIFGKDPVRGARVLAGTMRKAMQIGPKKGPDQTTIGKPWEAPQRQLGTKPQQKQKIVLENCEVVINTGKIKFVDGKGAVAQAGKKFDTTGLRPGSNTIGGMRGTAGEKYVHPQKRKPKEAVNRAERLGRIFGKDPVRGAKLITGQYGNSQQPQETARKPEQAKDAPSSGIGEAAAGAAAWEVAKRGGGALWRTAKFVAKRNPYIMAGTLAYAGYEAYHSYKGSETKNLIDRTGSAINNLSTQDTSQEKRGQPSSSIKSAFAKVSKEFNIPEQELMNTAWQESRYDIHAYNAKTGATGLFQFLASTWNDLISKNKDIASQYRISSAINRNDDRTDPLKATVMYAVYRNKNMSSLDAKGLTSGDKGVDAYLTHFLGPGGAARLLRAFKENPNAKVDTAVSSSAINANKNMFIVGGVVITITEFIDKIKQKLGGAPKVESNKRSPTVQQTSDENTTGGRTDNRPPTNERVLTGVSEGVGPEQSIGNEGRSVPTSNKGVSNLDDVVSKQNSGVDLDGLTSDTKNKLTAVATDYKDQTGQKLQINSGYRSREKQQALYDKYGPGRAAKPGKSNHEKGTRSRREFY